MSQRTSLHAQHLLSGAKMTDFFGWEMPLHYGSQIDEHHAVRKAAGMFDVSHMTVVDVHGADALAFLRRLLANDVARLDAGGALYSAMLNDSGGVIDDLIVYAADWGYRVVTNSGTREKDLAWMHAQVHDMKIDLRERSDLAIVAVQGPQARSMLHKVVGGQAEGLDGLSPFSAVERQVQGQFWHICTTGYTGEQGYEVILPKEQAPALWDDLREEGAKPCGLAARDTLRLEAGMNLYGHEMDETILPSECNMSWTVAMKDQRNFLGRAALEQHKRAEPVRLVGLILDGRQVMRQGFPVFVDGCEHEGVVTSGSWSPTLGCAIALARIPGNGQSRVEVEIRKKRYVVDVVKPCFVKCGQAVHERRAKS